MGLVKNTKNVSPEAKLKDPVLKAVVTAPKRLRKQPQLLELDPSLRSGLTPLLNFRNYILLLQIVSDTTLDTSLYS